MKRLILEIGTGNDLYGQDYTKAGCRAVQDAIHHSSLTLFKSLGIDHKKMQVKVKIAVQKPEKVDKSLIALELPRGEVIIEVVKGGLDIEDIENKTISVIANAAVEACLDIKKSDWTLTNS